MAHHVLGDIDRDELPAVVHGHRVADELRDDRGAARPGLQHLLLALAVELLHPLLQPLLDVRPFPGRASHWSRLLLRPARHDVAVRRARAAPRLVSLGRLAPRGHRVVALPLAFAAPHGMVDRIHHRSTNRRPEALPAHAARLADGHVLVVEVADLADRGHAVELDLPHLARRQLEVGVVALFGQELGERPRAPAELAALARLQLDVVHERTERNIPDRQRVAREDVSLRARHDHVARLEAERRDDVALLAVPVMQEGDASRAARIVLDPLDDGWDTDLLAPEIDLTEHALVPAAPVADGDAPVDVPPASPLLGGEQALLGRLLRDLLVGQLRHVPP